jgi:hypothetical protein
MPYPSDWGIFLKQMKDQPTSLDGELGIFGARYRLASEFSGLQLGSIGADTAAYYSAITKIGLAYTCLERLEKILKDDSHSAINAPDLAGQLRHSKFQSLIDLAIDHSDNKNLISKIESLRTDSEFVNVRPMIEAIRHSLFHGRFTPGTSGQRINKSLLELLDGLANVTLRHANHTFSFAVKLRR